MQRIAIVDPTESSRESLRALLLGVDFVWLEAECARYEYFFDVIQQSMPDLAVVALDADKNKALQMIAELTIEHPKLPILTISHDHQALLQSLQRGAKYFLTHPVGLEDLLSTLRRAVNDTGGAVEGQSQSVGGLARGGGSSCPAARCSGPGRRWRCSPCRSRRGRCRRRRGPSRGPPGRRRCSGRWPGWRPG